MTVALLTLSSCNDPHSDENNEDRTEQGDQEVDDNYFRLQGQSTDNSSDLSRKVGAWFGGPYYREGIKRVVVEILMKTSGDRN